MAAQVEKDAGDSLKIAKTIKLFIGGDFPRTESGRSAPILVPKTKKLYAYYCKASRKDLRNAVTAAQSAQAGWQSKSAYNRAQILYRMAEMAEAKREEFIEILVKTLAYPRPRANRAVDDAIQAWVYYAGFADKYEQLVGSVNPVSGPHHNFTSSEPVGVVALIPHSTFDLGQLVAQLAAIIASGNSVVAVLATEGAAILSPLAEVLATSDLPKGVVNLLTGDLEELYPHLGSHMEINSISYQGSQSKILAEIKTLAAGNLKRVVPPVTEALSLDHLIQYVEFKTVWHPVGH